MAYLTWSSKAEMSLIPVTTSMHQIFDVLISHTYLFETIQYSFVTGQLFRSTIRGTITMIPKKNRDACFIKNLRPITLLNTDYKLIEKVIANRIKPLLQGLIHQDQKGFLSNRRIGSNIRCILDIMDHLEHREREDRVVISIDYEKCFDRVEAQALLGALKFFNFPDNIINWTETIYRNAQSCVTNFGYQSRFFNVTRSIKQGGPCSSYYFLVVVELLAILLRNNQNIESLKLGDLRKLFSQYADDMDIYCKNTEQNMYRINQNLESFCKQTGFKINYEKTTVYCVGKDNSAIAKIYTIKGMHVEQEKINVLGVRVTKNYEELMKLNYKELIDKSRAILMNWTSRKLSLILIINTLIASLYVYKMLVLPRMSTQQIKMLYKISEQFIWDGRKPKIPLHKLQNSKKCGGLGLVDLRIKGNALRASWIIVLQKDEVMSFLAYQNLNKYLQDTIWKCNIKMDDVKFVNNNVNNFWRQVLEAWSWYNFKDQVTMEEISDQIVWFNSHIHVGNQPIFVKKSYLRGLTHVRQLFKNGLPLTGEEAYEIYDLEPLTFNSIMSTIPKNWKVFLLNNGSSQNMGKYKVDAFICEKKPIATYYQKMISQEELMHNVFVRWVQRLKMTITYNEFINLFKNIYEPSYRIA